MGVFSRIVVISKGGCKLMSDPMEVLIIELNVSLFSCYN